MLPSGLAIERATTEPMPKMMPPATTRMAPSSSVTASSSSAISST
jgi:hypothetical protein